jgi:8-oxo-dGTP diphosphatase
MSNESIACVGAVVYDRAGRLLMIQRGQEPGLGLWSLPGGRVERGESDHQAVVREVLEETGLTVRPGRLLGEVRRAAPSGGVYVISDYLCEPLTDDPPMSATDAADARWVDEHDYSRLPLVEGLSQALREWDVYPGS